MQSFRELKRQARKQLHDSIGEGVVYISMIGAEPAITSVRLHTNVESNGELRRSGFAEAEELVPKIVFMNHYLKPSKNSVVVTDTQGAFICDIIEPPHDITTTAIVTQLNKTEYVKWGLNPAEPWCGLPISDIVAANPDLPTTIFVSTTPSPLPPFEGSPSTVTFRVDDVSPNIMYKGEAAVGSLESAAVWRIKKLIFGPGDDITELWAGGTSAFDKVWDSRLSLVYS